MAIKQIPIIDVIVSPLNPRRLPAALSPNEEAAIEELRASIAEHGILEPCIGREVDGRVELLVGQRRLLAARRLGLQLLPVDVRKLNDKEAVRVALTEQLQREDLHPLDEAEAYQTILGAGEGGALDELATSIGKSPSYVRKRLSLGRLSPASESAFRNGGIDLQRALYLARIPSQKVQEHVLNRALVVRPKRGEHDPAGPNALRAIIEDDHMRDLREAPFDLEDVALDPLAGPCTTCPKNTAQAPELFDDVQAAGMCTDEECYASKCQAAYDVRAKDLLAKKKIAKAHPPTATKKLFGDSMGHGVRLKYGTGKVDLDEKKWDHASGSEKKWRTILKEQLDKGAIKPELALRPDGTVAELVSEQAAQGVAQRASRSTNAKPKASPAAREKNRAEKREADVMREVAGSLFRECVGAAATKGEAIVLRLAVQHGQMFQLDEDDVALISTRLKTPDDLDDGARKLDIPELRKATVAIALVGMQSLIGNELREELVDAAKLLGVDVKRIEREVRAQAAAQAPTSPTKGKAAKKGRAA